MSNKLNQECYRENYGYNTSKDFAKENYSKVKVFQSKYYVYKYYRLTTFYVVET